MAGESITHLIFFIGAIVIAVGVIGVVASNVQSITASYGINSKTLADQLKTDITIINDPEKIPYSSGTYSFFVKNTGKSTLDPTEVNMFIDGNYVNTTNNVTVMEGGYFWYPTYVIRLNYTGSLSSGDHTVRVIAGNGVFDTMPFKI
jgi:flagellar protein FlaG